MDRFKMRQLAAIILSLVTAFSIVGCVAKPTENSWPTPASEQTQSVELGGAQTGTFLDGSVVDVEEFQADTPWIVLNGNIPEFTEADLTPTSDAKHAVLVVHGVAAGDPSLKQQDEMREIPIAKWIMDMPWDYVAFGHYHMPGWVPGYVGKAAYSGSLENTVISGPDVCMHRGPVYVDLDADGDRMMTMHEMPVRSIIELEPLDLSGKDLEPAEIDEEIDRHIAQGNTDGAIVRLMVKGITRSAYKSLPRRNFMQSNPEAMHIKIDWEFATDGMAEDASVLLEDEDGNPVLDEAGNEVVSEEGIRERGFLPLAKEAELALLRLIEAGQISPSKQADITAVLQQYLQ